MNCCWLDWLRQDKIKRNGLTTREQQEEYFQVANSSHSHPNADYKSFYSWYYMLKSKQLMWCIL